MKESILKVCPICGKELKISKLQCTECDMEYSGNFNMSVFFKLEDAEIEFIKEFLKNEGNLSKIQKDSGRTYANVKSLINNINIKLGLIKEKKENVDMGFFDQKNETGIIKVIQDKFLECGGVSKMPMLKGNPLDIWVASSGNGVENSGFPALVCEWHILEAIVKKANELGGIMYRGDAAAQKGAKIGSAELPLDTIEAFISIEFYGGSLGTSTTRRSTYYAAILAWAGIVENHRSKGNGGYISVNPQFRS